MMMFIGFRTIDLGLQALCLVQIGLYSVCACFKPARYDVWDVISCRCRQQSAFKSRKRGVCASWLVVAFSISQNKCLSQSFIRIVGSVNS